MMHLVTYALGTPRDITGLLEEFKRCVSWWHFIDSTWIIITSEDTGELVTRLKPYLLPGDFLLAVEITKESDVPAGFLPPEAWSWINDWKNGSGARAASSTRLPPG